MRLKKTIVLFIIIAFTFSTTALPTFAQKNHYATQPPVYSVSNPAESTTMQTDDYIITFIPDTPSAHAPRNTTYTIQDWKPAGNQIAHGRMFSITANNTVYLSYNVNWSPSANVSIGTYSTSFKTAITTTGTSNSGTIKIETFSNPVTLAFAVCNNSSSTITVNGDYNI